MVVVVVVVVRVVGAFLPLFLRVYIQRPLGVERQQSPSNSKACVRSFRGGGGGLHASRVPVIF